jgi:hypothetical protein
MSAKKRGEILNVKAKLILDGNLEYIDIYRGDSVELLIERIKDTFNFSADSAKVGVIINDDYENIDEIRYIDE